MIIIHTIVNINVVKNIGETCDHLMIELKIKFKNQMNEKLITNYDYKNENKIQLFEEKLYKNDCNIIFNNQNNINKIYNQMITSLNIIKTECFPPIISSETKEKTDPVIRK